MFSKQKNCSIHKTNFSFENTGPAELLYFVCTSYAIFLVIGVPDLKENCSDEDHDQLIKVAKMFECPELENIINNIKNDLDFLNPSIGTYLNDETGKRMKNLFLNKKEIADIVFKIEGNFFIYFCLQLKLLKSY